MLLAKNMPLADVVAEIARYRTGRLHCDPAVAQLRLSGTLSLKDTDASLALLAQSLPVQIEWLGHGVVRVVGRSLGTVLAVPVLGKAIQPRRKSGWGSCWSPLRLWINRNLIPPPL